MKTITKLMMLLLAPLAFALSSCSDDDDLPQVNISVDIQDVSVYDDVLYVVQGEPLKVNSITVKSLTDKAATVTNIGYYWDGFLTAVSNVPPFSCDFNTAGLEVGNHLFQIKMTVLQVDKSIAVSWVTYKVKVVADKNDIPSDADVPGEVTLTATADQK